eukprot:CAMPEP_0172831230 /NCGR_PEP_ID=MMETSP1075-20121228/22833_1 /TAXON_ID=2916 /ORGANISM="Ceratium fusus, Strain PA161109" /LENGTH=80 /DNA_ID=CAMNT_0013673669 /DNA_START=299 /DNA_END=538 /DNA_ORIENTATION=-
METKRIMRSLDAPRSLFQVGSTLMVSAGIGSAATPDLFRQPRAQTMASALAEDWQNTVGTYILVSSGYRVQADIDIMQNN